MFHIADFIYMHNFTLTICVLQCYIILSLTLMRQLRLYDHYFIVGHFSFRLVLIPCRSLNVILKYIFVCFSHLCLCSSGLICFQNCISEVMTVDLQYC